MKFLLVIVILIGYVECVNSQSDGSIFKSYCELNPTQYKPQLIHGPISTKINSDQITLFFVKAIDTVKEEFVVQGVLYNNYSGSYTKFGKAVFNPNFCNGVISLFFENIDYDSEKEIIVIYEHGLRTFYTDGGYAGIKLSYQTRVFDYIIKDGAKLITEYKAIGDLLTINSPMLMGSAKEEELIGRENANLNSVLDVTSTAGAVRKRILKLKESGLLGNQK
jgi:hypothetical protein